MHDIIFFVKTPNTLYIFTIPHSKIPSPKKTVDRMTVFFILSAYFWDNTNLFITITIPS